MNELMKIINAMDNSELNVLQEMINTRKSSIGFQVRAGLRIGDKVKVEHKKLYGQTLTVTDIRQKRATLRNDRGQSFNVPMTMISA